MVRLRVAISSGSMDLHLTGREWRRKSEEEVREKEGVGGEKEKEERAREGR